MLNIRNLILSATLVVLLLLANPLATARTQVISDPSGDSASVSNHPEESANQNKAPIPSYRSPLDVCYDVPLREVTSCRNVSQVPIPSYRSPLDECYDVGLIERAKCLRESQKLVQPYRSPLDECYDVGLSDRAQCLSESQVSTP